MKESLYSNSPDNISPNFTKPGASYKKQVVFVLGAMLLFMLIYLTIIATAGFLVYWSVSYPITSFHTVSLLLKLGAIAMAVMLFAFLIKSLFKRHNTQSSYNIEIKEEEHPQLFAFIRQLCRETGAPLPHKVFVNHEINACVFYNSTFLSLFFPVKKNLLIGLGLVNTLNLSEFKAVLAHEFGHFAQRSMKLGSYVYMANHIIHSMVYERDKWDELLEQWKRADLRLSVFAWGLMPVVWLLRKSMGLVYQGINLVHASLARQMEFHADKVAVSVAGSDAIINALYKLGPSSDAFDFANGHLYTAADHKLYSSNLFYHHQQAVQYLSRHHTGYREALFEHREDHKACRGFLFTADDELLPQMYASHPSNFKREQKAKELYIACAADERSPWLLFDNPEALARQVSINLLRINLQLPATTEFSSPELVQQFIDAELAEITYKEHYKGIYDDRFLSQLDLRVPAHLLLQANINPDLLQTTYQELYGPSLSIKMKKLVLRQKDMHSLSLLLQQRDKRKTITLSDGKTCSSQQAKALYETLCKRFEADSAWYEQWDCKVFALHYLLVANDPQQQEMLLARYRFQLEWQPLHQQALDIQQQLQENLAALLEKESLTEAELTLFSDKFSYLHSMLTQLLKKADKLQMPPFNNMAQLHSMSEFLLNEPVAAFHRNQLDAEQINKIVAQTALVADRMRRIHFKSLGSILALQESIVARHHALVVN